MSQSYIFLLMLFGALGFGSAGTALAVARSRELAEGETDLGMRAIALLLAVFGAACTVAATGIIGTLAFGSVIGWFSYMTVAQRVGVFEIVRWRPSAESPVERRRIA